MMDSYHRSKEAQMELYIRFSSKFNACGASERDFTGIRYMYVHVQHNTEVSSLPYDIPSRPQLTSPRHLAPEVNETLTLQRTFSSRAMEFLLM